MSKQFAGTVLVNGSARRLKIDGNPLGRTVIQVDGATAYDKKPFIQKETIGFDIVPGKKAMLRWQQVSLTGLECDVTVDGRTTTLPSMARDGTIAQPVGAKQRQEFKVRAVGTGFVAAGVGSMILNYFELQSGSYYPKYLMAVPVLLLYGLIMLINPRLDLSSSGKRKTYFVAGLVLFGVGWFFKNWFLSTFGPQ